MSTSARVASMNRLVASAARPPVNYRKPHRNGIKVLLNSSGCVFRYRIMLRPCFTSSIRFICISSVARNLV
ncbi:MAG: hypothetical protein ACK55Z_13605, partial [bacterium]